MDTLAKRIRWVLQERGMSRKEWSLKAGLSQSMVSQLASGKRKKGPEFDTLEKLARSAGVSVVWLAEGRGEPMATNLRDDPYPSRVPVLTMLQYEGYPESIVQSLASVRLKAKGGDPGQDFWASKAEELIRLHHRLGAVRDDTDELPD